MIINILLPRIKRTETIIPHLRPLGPLARLLVPTILSFLPSLPPTHLVSPHHDFTTQTNPPLRLQYAISLRSRFTAGTYGSSYPQTSLDQVVGEEEEAVAVEVDPLDPLIEDKVEEGEGMIPHLSDFGGTMDQVAMGHQ